MIMQYVELWQCCRMKQQYALNKPIDVLLVLDFVLLVISGDFDIPRFEISGVGFIVSCLRVIPLQRFRGEGVAI